MLVRLIKVGRFLEKVGGSILRNAYVNMSRNGRRRPFGKTEARNRKGRKSTRATVKGSRAEAAFKGKKCQCITLKKIGIKIQRKMGNLGEAEGEHTV